jgi:23S rRNA (uracil1939-C5)-methyltransferase/tRNA (uracil-5-)-methyltransferase
VSTTTKYTNATKEKAFQPACFVSFVCFVAQKQRFNDRPFAYHEVIELEIATLTNLGVGLGRVVLPAVSELGICHLEPSTHPPQNGWVVMVAFALPGERVRARVFRNHPNYSEADLVEVLTSSPHRVAPRCALFGRCGGCQYQNLAYAEQLRWKQRQVQELLRHLAGIETEVAPVIASPREFGYRSKITPHFAAPPRGKGVPGVKSNAAFSVQSSGLDPISTLNVEPRTLNLQAAAAPDLPIGFLRQGSRHDIVDVPRCEIATDAINAKLAEVRADVWARAGTFQRGATLLLREAAEGVTTDYGAVITEEIPAAGFSPRDAGGGRAGSPDPAVVANVAGSGDPAPQRDAPGLAPPAATGASPPVPPLRLRFLARDFFQNNPFLLPAFAGYVGDQAAASGAQFLIDAYCGSGLFALAAASRFARVAGVEISETSVAFARENAIANGIANATFRAGDAASIFGGLDFAPGATVVVIDPPRKGCDEAFLRQLFAFSPRAVVYVSCDPATQMRDLRQFLAAGYTLTTVQPFDLFPQTRHLECVITLRKTA